MIQAEPEAVVRPYKRLREKTTVGEKRFRGDDHEDREHGTDDLGDTNMLMLTLAVEAKAGDIEMEENDEEQIMLESGWQWAPKSWVIKGDEKEMQGLIDKGTLKFIETPPTEAKIISSKVVRSFKGDGVKSRLVMRDIARTKPAGGEL